MATIKTFQDKKQFQLSGKLYKQNTSESPFWNLEEKGIEHTKLNAEEINSPWYLCPQVYPRTC